MAKKPPPRPSARKRRRVPSARATIRAGGAQGRVHLYVGISLDGYIAAPDGGVDWLNPYADGRAGYTPFIKTIGSAIMGRATYDFAVAHGYRGSAGMPSYVVTNRPLNPPSPFLLPWSGDLSMLVRQLRERHPRDIWLMGGGKLTKSFAEADLIDIWTVAFVPTFLGAGLPLFPPGAFSERRVRLARMQTYPSGVVQLRYERAGGRPRPSRRSV